MSTFKKFLVKIGLADLSSTQKVDKGRNHVTMLTANSNYPELQAGLPELGSACDSLELSVQEVQFNGGKIAYDRKNQREKELDELVTYLGEQVQVLSFGDKSKILSAGFDVRRANTPIYNLNTPGNLRAKISSYEGTVDLLWKNVHGARSYKVMMTAGDPTSEEGWVLVGVTTRAAFAAEGLDRGKTYCFRVNAIGARTESAYSDIAKSLAA